MMEKLFQTTLWNSTSIGSITDRSERGVIPLPPPPAAPTAPYCTKKHTATTVRNIMKKFSIIIPAHNDAGYIRKALDSIAAQTFEDYELIVICDACDDDTEAIAREYNAIVKTVNNHNAGPTRSAGLDIATGEWILFMDSDDWWLHEYVLEQLNQQLGDEDLLCFGFIWKGRGYTSPNRKGGFYWPAVWNKCWRRSAIGDTRFPSTYPDDLFFHNRMMEKFLKIRTWEMPLYYYNYWREGSISWQREPDLRFKK